ncbi:MAG: hypothetical protein M3Z64_00660 [Verrucomicrobiota bacterium]|nr:hypothetical protein [Verrucomicrobiota bacterium]
MKNTILALGCALIAPVAFAQTSTSTTETTVSKPVSSSTTTTESTTTKPVAASTSTTETSTTTTSTDGTVSTFEPGKTIVVRRVGVTDPISYTLGKTVNYVNRAGRTIEASLIRPGVPVHVYYDNSGGTQVVSRVVVDQD